VIFRQKKRIFERKRREKNYIILKNITVFLKEENQTITNQKEETLREYKYALDKY